VGRRRALFGLAAASNLIGLGFSYAAPMMTLPATLVLAFARKDRRGPVILVASTLVALATWLVYVQIRVGLSSLQTGEDGFLLLFKADELRLWKEAALTFLFRMFTPVALIGAVIWLASLLDRRAPGDLVLIAWAVGLMVWLLSAPFHSRVHDFWWLPLGTPLALVAARVSLNVFASRPGRAAAVVLMLGITAWMSVDRTAYFLDWREHGVPPVEFGQTVKPYLDPNDLVIGWYPNEIWHTGAAGYISGMIRGPEAYSEIIARERPALIVVMRDDPLWFYGKAWDAGYVPFSLYGWITYFRDDKADLVAAGDPELAASLRAIGIIAPGSLVRVPEDPVTYYCDWGIKMLVTAETSVALKLGSGPIEVQVIQANVLNALPAGPALQQLGEGSVISGSDGELYLLTDGERRPLGGRAALEGLGLAKAPMISLPDRLIALIPLGLPLGTSR
jgi:hypothetical protein